MLFFYLRITTFGNQLRDQKTCVIVKPAMKTTRRSFLKATTAAALVPIPVLADRKPKSESLVKKLYDTLDEKQRKAVAFPWDYKNHNGLLRKHISNNWLITKPLIRSNFFTKDQQTLIRGIWEGLLNPDWIDRFDLQLKHDMGGWGKRQAIAIFGEPGTGKFEFVQSGRHGTLRCDGDSAAHVAFAGPIMYGDEGSSGYFEKVNHPDNIFWHQALEANKLYQMLDGKLRKQALQKEAPDEAEIAFRGHSGQFTGAPVADMTRDQKEHMQKILRLLLEPFRKNDRDEAVAALKKNGGLDQCHLTLYKRDDLGRDGIYENWRLEGPAFVWHWRGAPHVHVWVHVADSPKVELNSRNRSGLLRKKGDTGF